MSTMTKNKISVGALKKAINSKAPKTNNGAITYATSLNSAVDFFSLAGASRDWYADQHVKVFSDSFDENPLAAMKILFWSRDVRGGAGERNIFKNVLTWLQKNHPDLVVKNLDNIVNFGYWKDIVVHLDPEFSVPFIVSRLKGTEDKGLMAKWLPRKGPLAFTLAKELKMSRKEYRKLIVGLSNTVEQKMSENAWAEINYEHVPSKAAKRYIKAFYKKDGARYKKYLGAVEKGEAKINASTLFPSDIVMDVFQNKNTAALEALWKALPDYTGGTKNSILPVCDVSGSMMGVPMYVSIGLGLYLSERNFGIFQNKIMTFSGTPQLFTLKATTLRERVSELAKASWGMNTNLQAVFDLILSKGVDSKTPEDEMPKQLLVISDMEFDSCAIKPNYEVMRDKYREAGYSMPQVVFWNVKGRAGNSPATTLDKDTCLVSGFSPAIMTSVLGAQDFTPVGMLEKAVLDNPRYATVVV